MTLGAGRSACDIVLFVGAGLSVKNHIATSEFLLTIPDGKGKAGYARG